MKYLTTLFFFLIVHTSFSQKIVVELKPEAAQLYLQSVPVKNVKKINLKTPSMGIVAVKDGYVTQGFTFGALKKIKSETFKINLKKISTLPNGYNSKAVELKKITDATGKIEKPDRVGLYGITIKGTALNSPLFINGICEVMSDFGYNVLNATNVFEDDTKSGNADLAIVGDLKYFAKDTRGIGYQISIVVEWSVYSFAEKKVILKIKTGGYSDTGETKFNSELAAAFQDAVIGLLSSAEFQEIAEK